MYFRIGLKMTGLKFKSYILFDWDVLAQSHCPSYQDIMRQKKRTSIIKTKED